jgi:hypothetical protein
MYRPQLPFDNGRPLVQFVRQQTARGVTGPALASAIVQHLEAYYPPRTEIAVVPPRHGAVSQPARFGSPEALGEPGRDYQKASAEGLEICCL